MRHACFGVVAALASSSAFAQVVWTTGNWDQVDARASDQTTDSSRPPNRAADDFTLVPGTGAAYEIASIQGDLLANNYVTFFAEIYADQAGAPEDAPLLAVAEQSRQVVSTGVFGLYDHVRVTFDTEGVMLMPGTYWVSLIAVVGGVGNEGYGFFCTAGNGNLLGDAGYYRGGTQPWKPIIFGLGFDTDFAFTVEGEQPTSLCKPDCEGDQDLDVFDFLCFQGKFSVQDPYADFEGDGDWDLFDFLAFQNAFATGC